MKSFSALSSKITYSIKKTDVSSLKASWGTSNKVSALVEINNLSGLELPIALLPQEKLKSLRHH